MLFESPNRNRNFLTAILEHPDLNDCVDIYHTTSLGATKMSYILKRNSLLKGKSID